MIIEIYKKWITKHGNVKNTIKNGWYIEWTPEKIQKAFNSGNGSAQDFEKYKKANKKYCVFMEV